MINLFRRIREQLLSQNRFRKYMIYAIGEILLVVVGILIALQVNNWNQERKSAKDISSALYALQKEIALNISYLETVVNNLESDLKDIELALYTINTDNPESITDSILVSVPKRIGPFTFRPLRQSAYSNIVSSDLINLVKDDSLKLQIIDIERGYQIFDKYSDGMITNWEEELRPYYLRNIDVLEMLDSIYLKEVPKTTFSIKKEAFVNNQYLSNILAQRSIVETNSKRRFKNMIRVLENLQDKVEAYLEDN